MEFLSLDTLAALAGQAANQILILTSQALDNLPALATQAGGAAAEAETLPENPLFGRLRSRYFLFHQPVRTPAYSGLYLFHLRYNSG